MNTVRDADGCITCGITRYRWKHFVGPVDLRPPYNGNWYPQASASWRIAEFLNLCEASGTFAVVTLNNFETPTDLADLVEWAHGNASTVWGKVTAECDHTVHC